MADEPKLEVHRWPQGKTLTQDAVADEWRKDGFSCGLWVDPPGQSWLGFVHLTDERVVVKEGTVEVEVEGAHVVLGPGDEVFIPAGARHSVWNRGRTTARWYYGYRKKKRAGESQ